MGTASGRAVEAAFVGREDVLGAIGAVVEGLAAGRGGLVVLEGEAGIGKTTAAGRVAGRAAPGVHVGWARCWEGGVAPPFWPWCQLVDDLAERALPSLPGGRASDSALAIVAPGAAERWGTPAPPPDATPTRPELLAGAAAALGRAVAAQPSLFLIEDIQWADLPSLLLLGHLAPQLERWPLVVVATLRTGEPVADELAEQVHDLRARAQVLPLGGLGRADVAALVVAHGLRADDGALDALVARSGGNPFLVTELLRAAAATSPRLDRRALEQVPRQVTDVVQRRLARLPSSVAALIGTAAVLGPEGDVDVLAAAAGVEVPDALDALGAGVEARLLEDLAGGRWRFAHALVRDAVVDGLPARARRELHLRALDALGSSGRAIPAAALARHAAGALPLGDRAEARRLAGEAAQEAAAGLAYESAAQWWATAVDLADDLPAPDRATLLLEQGAAHRHAGAAVRAKAAFAAGAELAGDDPALLATAALGYADPGADLGLAYQAEDPQTAALLERALAAQPPGDSVRTVRLTARLGSELYFSRDLARCRRATDSAVAMARRLGDPGALVAALAVHHDSFVVGQVDPASALAGSAELLRLAEASGETTARLAAHRARVFDLLAAGDLAGADASIAAFRRLAVPLGDPALLWWPTLWRAMRALLEGRHVDAEATALDAYRVGDEAFGHGSFGGLAFANLSFLVFFLRREQGRFAELEQATRDFATAQPDVPSLPVGLALLLAETGQRDEAAAMLGALTADGCASLRDRNWPVSWFQLARVAALAGDRERAGALLRLGAPLAGSCIIVSLATACLGAADLGHAWLHAAAGDLDEADGAFRRAEATNARLGARSWLAQARADHAVMLLRRGAPGDRDEAVALLDLARAAADELDLPIVAATVQGAAAGAPLAAPAAEPDGATFRREGATWTLAFAGRTVRVPHAKGLTDLAVLLARPGEPVPAIELLALQADGTGPGATDSGPTLDERARRELRARLADLEADIDDADAANDLERAATARIAHADLVDAISRDLGLGGRARAVDDPVERARKAVTARVRNAIGRLAPVHPALAAHLDRSVDTGSWCTYRPERPVPWAL